MNRTFLLFALLIIAVLAAAMGSGLFLLGSTVPEEKKAPSAGEIAKTDDQGPKNNDKTLADPPKGENPSPGKASTPADDGKAAVPPAKVEKAKDAEERRQLLETIGTLTAAHCYQTYLNIGLLADGKAKGAYTEKDAYKVLDSLVGLVNSVDKKLAAIDKLDLDNDDRASVEQMRIVSTLLRRQAKELQAFWDTGRDEDAAQYESARKDAWALLSKLMGIAR